MPLSRVKKNPVVELVEIRRISPSVVTLSHVHASDRVGEYRGKPVCTGHLLTVCWGKKSASYLGNKALFFKKDHHWRFLMGEKEIELTPGARAKNQDEEVYQMLIRKFLALKPAKSGLPPMLGQHREE